MKIPRVMRNINEFNVPSDRSKGFEIMYFGVNQILMLEYRLSFDVSVKNSDKEIQVLIISRKDVPVWKNKDDTLELKIFYDNHGIKINDTFRPSNSDSYAFVINNRSPSYHSGIKTVEVALIHNWYQIERQTE
jgi:hypothetical protein